MPFARTTDPQTSHDAAASIPTAVLDKNKPSPELEASVLCCAEQLTRFGDFKSFTDEELARDVLPYMRASYGVKCKESTSSVRRARLWLSEQAEPRIVLTEEKREGCRVWRHVPKVAVVVVKLTQTEMWG